MDTSPAPEQPLDGPYVFYKGDQIFVKYVEQHEGIKAVKEETVPASQKETISLKVATDDPQSQFTVRLQKKLENQKYDYKKASKIIVLSDIEGNFTALRKLLQNNGVIDANYRWTFGEGHLVTIGDFFDRGDQVTEVLWLIYSLEEQAKEAGGHVHFVLGNHEIMNLSDDLRYLNAKYKETAQLLNMHYMKLYDENTELGRWLRTKNIVERVGKMLFLHAGVSDEITKMDAGISQLNQLARPYYADTTYNYKNPQSEIVMGDLGPFWYRGFYSKTKPTSSDQLDASLYKFGVKHIVTGHSLVADTVSLWYGGKVINTDTHHAKGHSEALLVEGDKFYRVNAEG
ncbi:MAG TPA: metallophosphoesterase, partial [Chitinophagaceae bacterium]